MICELCGKPAEHRHHLFPQYKMHKKLYPEFIHDPRNLMNVCASCHLTKTVPTMSEESFCKKMGIIPRSKTATTKALLTKTQSEY